MEAILSGEETQHGDRVGKAWLVGKSVCRAPHPTEQEVLQEMGVACATLDDFFRIRINFMECRSEKYALNEDDDVRSDNSHIYTKADQFGTITSIVKFAPGGERPTECGLFVQTHNVLSPTVNANHIGKITGPGPVIFIRPEEVRNLAIKCSILSDSYIMPMANNFEID